jgi:hypothetical protein
MMIRKIAMTAAVFGLAGGVLRADFSYQETSKITGGALAAMMRVAGVFSRQAREPIQSTVAVKGNRMVHRSGTTATVIDLGNDTITTIDMQRKTYSVMTFEQMKQMLSQLSKGDKDQAQLNFKVSANSTGSTKQVAGFDAKELVLKMEAEVKDKDGKSSGTMAITSDMWIANAMPGYAEVRDFQKRMAEKIAWAPGGNMFMQNPQVSQGMAEVSKEMAKLDGMPVAMTMTMGGPDGAAAGMAPAGDAAPQQTTQAQPQAEPAPQPQAQPERPSLSGALGGALGGRFGLGRKRSQPQEQPAAQTQPPAQQQQAANGAGGSTSGALLEMTTEMSGFSSAAVDDGLFSIPAGFKKVEPDTRRGR